MKNSEPDRHLDKNNTPSGKRYTQSITESVTLKTLNDTESTLGKLEARDLELHEDHRGQSDMRLDWQDIDQGLNELSLLIYGCERLTSTMSLYKFLMY